MTWFSPLHKERRLSPVPHTHWSLSDIVATLTTPGFYGLNLDQQQIEARLQEWHKVTQCGYILCTFDIKKG